MLYLVNHNSFSIIASLLWITVSAIAIRKLSSPGSYILSAVLAMILVGVFFIVRPKEASSTVKTSIQNQIGAGQVVLLEFQSPY